MRVRSFTAFDMVQLPRLDAGSAIAVGTSIRTAFEATKKPSLPKSIHTAANRLFAAHADLRIEFAARITETAASSDELRAADSELDACWAALYGLLGAYARLPLPSKEQAKTAGASRVLNAVFTSGLKFTQLPYKLQWVESQARLDLLNDKRHSADIKALGGELFLTTLRASHQRYGDLQGLTKESTSETAVDLRGKLSAFSDALRNYVVKVSALADEDDSASEDVVDKLLAPLQSWQTLGASRAPAEAPPVIPPVEPPAAAPAPTVEAGEAQTPEEVAAPPVRTTAKA